MAPKTKAEEKAEQAKQIADAVEAAVGAWAPLVGLAIKGVRLLIRRDRGEDVADELAAFERDMLASEDLVDQIDARGADYKRRREAEKAGQPG